MDMLLSRRRIDLIDKKPGTVMEEPKIIWTRMLKHPHHLTKLGDNRALALRGHFNSVLEKRLAEGPDHLCLISITLDEADFDMSGYLTSKGKSTFWKEMDRGIMKFDQGEISLMPRSVSSQQNSENLNSKQVSQLNNTSRKSKAKSASPPSQITKEVQNRLKA